MLVSALLFMAISIILLAVYFSTAGIVISYIQSNPQTQNKGLPSLTDGLNSTVTYISEFLRYGIVFGRVLTSDSINTFIDDTKVSD